MENPFRSDSENLLLLNWVADPRTAADNAYIQSEPIDVDALPEGGVKRTRKATAKRALMEQEVQENSAEKKQKVKEKERSDEMRARTEENPKYDPDDVIDAEVDHSGVGHPPNALLDKVSTPCTLISNPATGKDVVALVVFADDNSKLCDVIQFFRKSSFGTHHLTAWRQ